MKSTCMMLAFAAVFAAQADVLDNVDPFIGSGGTGHTTPAAAYPFGMVQPGPDTSHAGWARCSGYQYGDRRIERFSQNHLSGTGCSEFTDLGFMPAAGDPAKAWQRDYYSKLDKSSEKASPGYYAVTLECGTKVEATCTKHVSIFKFTFPKGEKKASLLFDASWSHRRVRKAEVSPIENRRVSGRIERDGWPSHHYFFSWEVSAEPTGSRIVKELWEEKIPKTVYDFDLGEKNVLYLKVALSRTSTDGARRSIDAEIPGWDFDGVLKANRAAWRSILSRVNVKGEPDQVKGIYTAVYHLCFQPNLISDAGEADVYSTFSCWDTYRAAGPLYTILTPEYVPVFINSMLWHFDNNGYLPVWTLWGKDNQCMIGVHSVPMIVDAYLKGFNGVDWNRAWECVRTTLSENRGRAIANYHLLDKYGYYPCDLVKNESVSRLLESCYDDACAARMAAKLGGRDEDARFFLNRSRAWTNCFDAATGFVRAKDSNGAWREPFDPYRVHGEGHHNYTEGNAFHWNWHVMQEPGLLVSKLGGKDAALKRLTGLFEEDASKLSEAPPDVTGLIGQYAHGNEPSHHVIYFFSLLGRRDLAAKYIREVVDTQYGIAPDGLCGNDDCGQMSAWYIFSAMGLYPFDPCNGKYVIGEAQVKEISIDVGGGKTFRVVSDAPGEVSRSVELNGRTLQGAVVRHADVMKGGKLRFAGGVPQPRPAVTFRIDASQVPEKREWAEKKLKPALEAWSKNVIELLDGKDAKWTRGAVTLILNPKDGVAASNAESRKIWLSMNFAEKCPQEVVGACIHELAHVVQDYRPAAGRADPYAATPGWLVEGIADWVRWVNYEGAAGVKRVTDDAKRNPKHDAAYGVTAAFLDYVAKKYDKDFVTKLNKLCRDGYYGEDAWTKLTKKTREQLAEEWKRKLGNGQ